jgi:hypothetical protein
MIESNVAMAVEKQPIEKIALINAIHTKMAAMQVDLDLLDAQFQAAMKAVAEVQALIIPAKEALVPWAELLAGVASVNARNKYFPEFAGRPGDAAKEKAFLEFVKGTLNG